MLKVRLSLILLMAREINDKGILGVPGEAKVYVTYEEVPGTFADGEAIPCASLRIILKI